MSNEQTEKVPTVPIEFDPVAADFLADNLMRKVRAGCYCAATRKPCSEHQMYEAGMDDLIDAIVINAIGDQSSGSLGDES